MVTVVSHALPICFVGLGLFGCTSGDTLFPPSPLLLSLSLHTQGRGDARGRGGWVGLICKISEVIVRKVAELVQRLAV